MKTAVYFILIGLWLAGCASNRPPGIGHAPAEAVNVPQVQADPDAHVGRIMRWGGRIIEVRNQPEYTDVLILATELQNDGKPLLDGPNLGRFIARMEGFQDPELFPAGKRATFNGIVERIERHLIGDYAYPYPVLRVRSHHVWPDPEPRYYHDPWPWGWGYFPGYPGWRHLYWWR